jgi:hypothetical protein
MEHPTMSTAAQLEAKLDAILDTNGHHRLTALNQERLCATFTAIYKARGYIYTGASPHDYPF